MWNFLTNLIESIIENTFIFVIFFILLLFLPKEIMVEFGLHDIVNSIRPILGLLLLISISIITIKFISKTIEHIQKKYEIYNNRKVMNELLHNLSANQKKILRCFIDNDTETYKFSYNNGPARWLVSKQVLTYFGQTTGVHMNITYCIQPWAREYLLENPELLK